MNEPILDRAAFETWLHALPPKAVVGRCGRTAECPLAEWIESLGATNVEVTDEFFRFRWRGEWQVRTAPGWAYSFITAVDKAGYDTPVTAAECLCVLGTMR